MALPEGQELSLEVLVRNNQEPATYYIGIGDNGGVAAVPAITSLGDITEKSFTGYSRQTLDRNTTDWGAVGDDLGDKISDSINVTFSNTGGSAANNLDYMFVATSSDNAGSLVDAAPFSQSYTLQPGENFTFAVRARSKAES